MARVPPAIARKPASMDTTAKRVSTRTTHIRVTRRTKRAWMTLKLAVARAWCPAAMVEQLQRWKGSYPCMIGRTRRCASKRLRTADGVRVKLYLIFTLWAMRSGLPRGLRYGLNKIRRKDRTTEHTFGNCISRAEHKQVNFSDCDSSTNSSPNVAVVLFSSLGLH